jgi:hypothetical protein
MFLIGPKDYRWQQRFGDMMKTNYSRSLGLTYGVKQKIGIKGQILHRWLANLTDSVDGKIWSV